MEFQQHYPTYNFKQRDVVLSEFEEAQKIANTRTQVYNQLASILIAFLTIGLTIIFNSIDKLNDIVVSVVKEHLILINIIFSLIALLVLRYFVELQRTIVLNSRKVVTLRKMLGLDYGVLQLTVPNWRVEGATNPFVIKLFPGWTRFGSSPFWIVTASINLMWYFSSKIIFNWEYWYVINISISIFFAFIYRIQLKEVHESIFLLIIKVCASVFRVKLVHDFEYTIYRSQLALHEKTRLKFDLENIQRILIKVEDSRFKSHKGVDVKALIRSILSNFKCYRKSRNVIKSGGSTITMQLCRTLFIPPNQNTIFRKLIEIMLAIWFERKFSKNQIIGFYLTSVRFERKVNGIIAAVNHFFPSNKKVSLSNDEAFFLVERLSNVSSTYIMNRVKSLFNRINSDNSLSWLKIEEIYKSQEKAMRIALK